MKNSEITIKAKKVIAANALKKLQAGKTPSAHELNILSEVTEENEGSNNDKQQGSWSIQRFCDEAKVIYGTVKSRLEAKGKKAERGSRFTLRELIDAYYGDLDAEKLRKLSAEADLAEIERDTKRKQLVELETVQADFARWAHRIKSVIEREVDNEETRLKIFRAIRKPLNEDVKAQEVSE